MAHAKNSISSNITLTYQTKHRYKKKFIKNKLTDALFSFKEDPLRPPRPEVHTHRQAGEKCHRAQV